MLLVDEHAPEVREAPLEGVSFDAWMLFVRALLKFSGEGVTENFRYGKFEFTIRRLCDLGLMTNPRPMSKRGRLIWDADWLDGWNLRKFLQSNRTQYNLFCRSMLEYSKEIGVQDSVGKSVDDTTTTLSGVLAVAHRAGISGLFSWLSNPQTRKEFSHTTDFFQRANKLF
jgi:hypothetical protein